MPLKSEAFLTLEKTLASKFHPKWKRLSSRVIRELKSHIKDGDIIAAQDAVESFNEMADFPKGAEDHILNLSMASVLFGASQLTEPKKSRFMEEGEIPPMVRKAAEQYASMFREMVVQVKRTAYSVLGEAERRILEEGEKEFLQKAAKLRTMDDLMDKIAKSGANQIDIASSLQTSRMSNFGFLTEAELRGVMSYQVNEVLDNLTCVVCESMHGRSFQVEKALGRVEQSIRTDNPEDLKLLSPWPKQDKASVQALREMSNADLQTSGFDAPPYHPYCRGHLVKEGTVVQVGAPVDGDKRFESATQWAKRWDDPAVSSDSILKNFPDDTAFKIQAVNQDIAALRTTDKMFYKNGVWDKDRVKNVHDPIIKDILSAEAIKKAKAKPGEQQMAMFGGRGGSGKSAFTKPKDKGGLGVVDEDKFVILDSDAIKQALPEYKGWNAFQVHEESSYLFDKITKMARDMNLNVVLDVTMKGQAGALKRLNLFKEKGYDISGYYMHLPRQEAAKRAVSRFLGPTNRYVPIDVVLSNTTNEKTWESLLEYFTHWEFYDNQVPMGHKPKLLDKKGG